MQKKYIVQLAEILKHNKGTCAMTTGEKSWSILKSAIADMCAETNEKFDYERFFKACAKQAGE